MLLQNSRHLPQTFILSAVVAVSSHLYFPPAPFTFSLFAVRKIPPFLFSFFHNLSGKLDTFRFAQNFPERSTLPTLKPSPPKEPGIRRLRIAGLFSYPNVHATFKRAGVLSPLEGLWSWGVK